MALTRRVQVFISQEASDALDRLVEKHGGQTKAIEAALILATNVDTVTDGRSNVTINTLRPLARRTVQPIPKPGGKK